MQELENVVESIRLNGIVSEVDEEIGCAYVLTVIGRVIVPPAIRDEHIKTGTWLSFTVMEKKESTLFFVRCCRYTAVGKPRVIEDVIPTGLRIDKNNVEVVRVQTKAMIGSTRDGGTIALSEHLGRIYVNPRMRESMQLWTDMWVEIGAQNTEPSEENAFCFWEAKIAATIEDGDKFEPAIRRCYGHFTNFLGKNMCVLELLQPDEGFVCVRTSDFITPVPPKKLREAKAIQKWEMNGCNAVVTILDGQPVSAFGGLVVRSISTTTRSIDKMVYANQAVSPLKIFAVTVCYARVLEEEEFEELTERKAISNMVATSSVNQTATGAKESGDAKENGDAKKSDDKGDVVAQEKGPDQDEDESKKVKHEPNCSNAQMLRELIEIERVAEELRQHNLDLYKRVTNFLGTPK